MSEKLFADADMAAEAGAPDHTVKGLRCMAMIEALCAKKYSEISISGVTQFENQLLAWVYVTIRDFGWHAKAFGGRDLHDALRAAYDAMLAQEAAK